MTWLYLFLAIIGWIFYTKVLQWYTKSENEDYSIVVCLVMAFAANFSALTVSAVTTIPFDISFIFFVVLPLVIMVIKIYLTYKHNNAPLSGPE